MLHPNHLQIKEKVICIYLIPAGCNLYYQAVQRLNATSIKFEETRYQSLIFTLRLRTIFLTCISNNWIILIKDNSTLYWQENMLQEHSRARGSHKLLQNLRIGEIAHNACRGFFFLHLCLCFIERNGIYSFLHKENLTHTQSNVSLLNAVCCCGY